MSAIDDLTVFYEVVRSGSLIGAAKTLGMTSSGVSRKISRFEERLGVRLFNRTTRSLSLTEAGAVMADRCETILSSISNAEAMVQELAGTPQGNLRIAASDALASEVIVPFLKSFSALYPDLGITLVQGDGRIDLLRERVDLAFMFEKPDETSFIARAVIDDPWIVCASPEYFAKHGRPETPADLNQHRCLTIHAQGHTRDVWAFEQSGESCSVKVQSAFSGIGLTVKVAALQGLGIARLAHFLVCPAIEQGYLQPALIEHMPPSRRRLYAVYPNRQFLPSKVRVFLDAFSQHMRSEFIIPPGLKRSHDA